MTLPRVTVLMSVYNGSPYVARAIESILSQTFTDFEFLVIDDASSDDSVALINSYADSRLRLVRNPSNLGLTRSLNVGLWQAKGDLIARHDADDIAHSRRLEKQVTFLDAHPEIALVGTQVRHIGPSGRRLWNQMRKPVTPLAIEWEFMFGNPFVHSSVMFRTGVMRNELGGYNETFLTSQDVEAWTRLIAIARVANLDEALLDFRSHHESISKRIYSASNVRRVEALLAYNIERRIGASPETDEWPHLWDCIVNEGILERDPRVIHAPRLLATMHRRFVERNPEASTNSEIRRSRARILAQIALHLTDYARILSFFIFIRSVILDIGALRAFGPRFLTKLIFGCGRRPRSAAKETGG